jgi:hypothetical protein
MFIEWWERFRGVDGWPEVRAVVQSVRSWGLPWIEGGKYGEAQGLIPRNRSDFKSMTMEYQSVDGVVHSKTVWLFFSPILFSLEPGDDFFVAHSPENPERIYIRERTKGWFLAAFILLINVSMVSFFLLRNR